ncbi:serine/threonine protein kinase [Mycolicibacterium moriokaense]|nr:serine/threonine protein kinase [Mycolicibacterium moriokaense]
MQAPEIIGGRYELRGILGRGGMAEVRDGWDIRLDRPVAVKVLHPAFSVHPDSRRRFEIEARAAAGLSHPHIVAVHDSGEHAGTPYIIMERLSGGTLADELLHGPLPQDRVRTVLADILSALAAAHAAGILHRDIKPANILLTDSGDVKVADFGIAKSAETPATMAGQIVGTMAYLSPDRVMGRPATVADDLYAVGAVGYEALAGRRPFPQENMAALARAISDGDRPPLHVVRPDVAPGLAAVVEQAMAHDPQWRFPSAEVMRAALSGAPPPGQARPSTRVLAAPLPPPTTMAVAAPARSGRTRGLLYLGAVVAAFVLAAILIAIESGSQPTAPKPVTTSTTSSTTSTTTTSTSTAPAPPPVNDEGGPPPGKKRGNGNGNGNGNGHKKG